jgi:two-component sensor histidine kinase
MIKFQIIFIILLSTLANAGIINLNSDSHFYDLLPHSYIYIDKSQSLTLKDIKKLDNKFEKNEKSLLGFGYDPKFNVWLKITLNNTTNKNMDKIIEYANPLSTDVSFFSADSNYTANIDGLFHISTTRKTVNPIFKIKLKPHEQKTYYIEASSSITTLIIKLYAWDADVFYKKELHHQLILGLFFGAMLILAIYNLFIYFFTKNISYLYYVIYILGITFHHFIYVGISNIYLNQAYIIASIKYSSLIVAIPVLALAFFTKYFLQVRQYPVWNKILNGFLILIPLSIIFFITTNDDVQYRNILTLSMLLYLIILTLFAALHKNRSAYFILFGWSVVFVSILLMFLSSQGIFDIYKYFTYPIETAIILEAVVFSIALAERINQLQKEKVNATKMLISYEKNATQKLELKVSEKTKELKIALNEKKILLLELNHRVKNNMQTIASLINLQLDKLTSTQTKDILITMQNRINAMSHLHELLYRQENVSYINAYEYFEILIDELQHSYDSDINISFNIKTELNIEHATYCGLILNELITNSLKHAFPEGNGEIYVDLNKSENSYKLLIWDNGIGYNQHIISDSLGLVLIDTLVKEQLRGDMNINTSDGTKVTIQWNHND